MKNGFEAESQLATGKTADRREKVAEDVSQTITITLRQKSQDEFDEKACAGCRMYHLCRFIRENGLNQSGASYITPNALVGKSCPGAEHCEECATRSENSETDASCRSVQEDPEDLTRWADTMASSVSHITGIDRVLVYTVLWVMMRNSFEDDFWKRIVDQASVETNIPRPTVQKIITAILAINGEEDGTDEESV